MPEKPVRTRVKTKTTEKKTKTKPLPVPVKPIATKAAVPGSARAALKLLMQGNQRFVEGKTRHAHRGAEWRAHLVGGQKPFATILGCSDSRVPIELVFDQGFGDLFVVRVAGNVISTDVVGTLEYAVEHLGTSLIVVMGHLGCGAVTAALAALEKPLHEPRRLESLLKRIEPGLPKNRLPGNPEKRLNAAVKANVLWAIQQLQSIPEVKGVFTQKRVMLIGGIYDLKTGKVQLVRPQRTTKILR